jgi:hypothetical protein
MPGSADNEKRTDWKIDPQEFHAEMQRIVADMRSGPRLAPPDPAAMSSEEREAGYRALTERAELLDSHGDSRLAALCREQRDVSYVLRDQAA